LPPRLINYQAMIGGPNDLYYLKREGSPVPEPKWNSQLIPVWYYEPVEVIEGGNVIMDIVTGDDRKPVLPGVVLSVHGKGKVLYSASSLESLFYSNGNPILKEFIASLVSAVTSAPLPYSVDAPAGLITNLSFSGNHYLFQMTNWTGNKFEKKHVMEDYIAPVSNVSVRFAIPRSHSVASVKSLTGSEIKTVTEGDTLEILIPHIGAYEGIDIQVK